MDYNTQRAKLHLPEYGRHVQQMIEQVKRIPDRDKRNEQIRAVIQVMATLNPQMKDAPDYRQKLWDHMYIIADFDIDVDSPYPMPDKKEFFSRPEKMHFEEKPIKARCYGRNIENMINLIAAQEDSDDKNEMICTLGHYMRQQYLIWNKDSVADETIFSDMEKLSDGRLKVPEGLQLSTLSSDATFNRPGMMASSGSKSGFSKKSRNKKKKKN
ncbi:MAG: DUF4290 domain-containing protein [Bacteroidales bacterium]|nr:DUF4290 domain-containing protein [Bacteroidales bacterium]